VVKESIESKYMSLTLHLGVPLTSLEPKNDQWYVRLKMPDDASSFKMVPPKKMFSIDVGFS